jgi:hypothetical protein
MQPSHGPTELQLLGQHHEQPQITDVDSGLPVTGGAHRATDIVASSLHPQHLRPG